jgi:hypothetical protein
MLISILSAMTFLAFFLRHQYVKRNTANAWA